MKPFAYFLCILVVILLVASPWLLLSYFEKLPEEPYFQGILHMWHISDWRTGGSSAYTFLENRIKQYEAQNPHVFIELASYTPEKAAKALADGQQPDIISYPCGTEPGFALASLPHQSFLMQIGEDNAYPYMFGGYCLLVNNDLLSENGVDIYEGWGIRPDSLLAAAQLGAAFDAEEGYSSLPALALHAYPPAPKPNTSTFGEPEPPNAMLRLKAAYTGGLDAFAKGEIAVLIASHRQLFEASERYTQGECPSFTAYAIGGYTDMAQLVSIAQQKDDELRQKTCEEFAAYLVSPSSQKKLEALGVFPSINIPDMYAENDALSAVFEQLCTAGCFVTPDKRQALDALAMDVYGGSEISLHKLRRLLGAAGS